MLLWVVTVTWMVVWVAVSAMLLSSQKSSVEAAQGATGGASLSFTVTLADLVVPRL